MDRTDMARRARQWKELPEGPETGRNSRTVAGAAGVAGGPDKVGEADRPSGRNDRDGNNDGWIQRHVEQRRPDGVDINIQPPPERDTNANSNGRKPTRTKRSGDHDSRTNELIQSNRTEERPRNDRNGLCPRRLERLKSDGSEKRLERDRHRDGAAG